MNVAKSDKIYQKGLFISRGNLKLIFSSFLSVRLLIQFSNNGLYAPQVGEGISWNRPIFSKLSKKVKQTQLSTKNIH